MGGGGGEMWVGLGELVGVESCNCSLLEPKTFTVTNK